MRLSCVIFLLFCSYCYGARILGVFPTPSYSHQIVFHALMKELAKRGHEVVMVSTDPLPEPMKNLTEIVIKEKPYKILRTTIQSSMEKWDSKDILQIFNDAILKILEEMYAHPEVTKIIEGKSGPFDVCFFEAIVPAAYGIREVYNCPTILLSSFLGMVADHEIVGNPTNPSIYRDPLNKEYPTLNFRHRLKAWYEFMYYKYYQYFVYYPQCDEFNKKYFGKNVRSMQEITNDIDMIFLNTFRIFGDLRPSSATTVYLGALHINKPKPLRTDIKTILDNAKNGAIYFSFGTNVNTTLVPEDLTSMFLNVFKKLPYTIIWKYDVENMKGKPSNVHIFKWLPQQDILAHPNVKMFVTQGGQQSTEEAIDRKVPMLVIPFLGDQIINAKKVEYFGIGRKMFLTEKISEQKIEDVLTDLMSNHTYRKTLKEFYDILHDEPMTALEKGVWWTEYVIRNKGAKMLRSESLALPFYVVYCLDILAFVLFSLSFGIFSIWYIIRRIRRILNGGNHAAVNLENKLKKKNL